MASVKLTAYQACFVVNDVAQAVELCRQSFGWGPFQHFEVPVADAHYHGWRGDKLTEVALGMAGSAQVELIRIHQGEDAIQKYQAALGSGLQHMGVLCQSTGQAIAHLSALGARLNDRNQYGDITFSFMDVPNGPALIELLERGERGIPTRQSMLSDGATLDCSAAPLLALDRISLVTPNIQQSTAFYSQCFSLGEPSIIDDTCHYGAENGSRQELRAQRCVLNTGILELELIQPEPSKDDPYNRQLIRARRHGDHGLVHVGGRCDTDCEHNLPSDNAIHGQWHSEPQPFTLYLGPDGQLSLQARG